MDNAEARLTAHHEAGHAVAGAVLGHPFAYVTIRATDDAAGHVRGLVGDRQPLNYDEFDEDADREMCIEYMAGSLAEARAAYLDPSNRDSLEDLELAMRMSGGDWDLGYLSSVLYLAHPYLDEVWADTKILVEEQWPAIHAVAVALVDRETLTHGEVLAIVHAS